MAKDTGMNAEDEKAGRTSKLSSSKADAANKKMKEDKDAPPPTKTIEMVKNAREKKINEQSIKNKI